MKYDDARAQIKTGDLLAWSHGGFADWHDFQVLLVRAFTRSEYSHVGLALVGAGRIFILEAVGAGVRLWPLSRELPFYWIARTAPSPTDPALPPLPRELGPEAVDFAFDRLGDRYSKLQAIRAFFGSLRLGEDDIWQCAEYVLSILKADGEVLTNVATPTGVVKAAARDWGPIHYVTD